MVKKSNEEKPKKAPAKKKDSPSPGRNAAGQFVKGRTKIGGRKVGTPNKATRDARTILGETLLDHLENVGTYIDNIEDDAKRVQAIASLLPFYMPKYQSTSLTADTRRSLSCEEEMQELDKQFAKKEIEISLTERTIINFDNDDPDE